MRLRQPTDAALSKVQRLKAKWRRKQYMRPWYGIMPDGSLAYYPCKDAVSKGTFVWAKPMAPFMHDDGTDLKVFKETEDYIYLRG